MAFWSSETLMARLPAELLVEPYDQKRVKHGAYELGLGCEAFVTSDPSGKKTVLKPGEDVHVPPGQFALLLVEEQIKIPADAIAFISIRAGIKFRGLVNVSGFHVDPGFVGHLKFAVYNAGAKSIVLSRGESVFLIWFSCLDGTTEDTYNGNHAGENRISSEDIMRLQGTLASPASLNERLERLEGLVPVDISTQLEKLKSSLDTWKKIGVGLFVGVLLLILGAASRGVRLTLIDGPSPAPVDTAAAPPSDGSQGAHGTTAAPEAVTPQGSAPGSQGTEQDVASPADSVPAGEADAVPVTGQKAGVPVEGKPAVVGEGSFGESQQ